LSLLLIDIDHFKALNDHYGHPYGDECLIEVAAAMQSVLVRGGDLLARYGGEEFAVILPATNSHGAEAIASHMRDAVRALRLEHEGFHGGLVSISIGIASADLPQDESPRLLIKASDEALYRAKLNGRDRIEHA
jgi:diguanylate cyclase (GGDEF)-like protein